MIAMIGRWGFTIMVIPKRGEVRRVAVPWLGVIAVVAALGTIVYFPFGQADSIAKQRTINQLNARNKRLQKENAQVKPAIDRARELEVLVNRLRNEHAAVISALESVRRKSRTQISSRGGFDRPPIYRLPDPVVSPTDGDVSLLETLEVTTESLTKEVTRQLAASETLKKELLAYERQLDHTPSVWPVYGRLTSWFGYRRDPVTRYSAMHEGIDLATPMRSSVRAVADGVVSFAGRRGGYGWTVIINHGYGYQSLYGHNDSLLVKPGQSVRKGQVIARSGSSGKSTGPHLHLEIWVNGKKVNPLTYMR